MADNDMVGIEKINEIVNDYFPGFTYIDYHGVEIKVYRSIPYYQFTEIVRRVADSCFDHVTGEYLPEVFDFATRICKLSAYTNVEIPTDVESQNSLVFNTDLLAVVEKNADREQWDAIDLSIMERIRVRNNVNRKEFEHALQRAVTAIEEFAEGFSGLFDNVSSDDLNKIIQSIGDGGIDVDKLAHAVVSEQNKINKAKPEFKVIEGGSAESADIEPKEDGE